MSYGKLYGRQVFEAEVNGRNYVFTCYGQDTSYGFRHICTEGYNNTEYSRWIKSDIVAKATYYNRTWERFKYETVLRRGIEEVAPSKDVEKKLKAILIDKKADKEHEEAEAQIKAFENLWNGLSDKNKEHVRNGLGGNLIQTEDQARAVMGVMACMNLMQE